MKSHRLLLIFLVFVQLGCHPEKENVDHFSRLDPQHEEIILELLDSFNQFLDINFGGHSGETLIIYLEELSQTDNLFSYNWKFPRILNQKILDDIAFGDNHHLFHYYGYEIKNPYDSILLIPPSPEDSLANEEKFIQALTRNKIEFDSALHINDTGAFVYTIQNIMNQSFFDEYFKLKREESNISPAVFINGLLQNSDSLDFNSPALRALIIRELYLDQIEKDLKR